MRFLFCPLYEINQNEVINNSKTIPNFAITNFNAKMIKGFYKNLNDDLYIISTRTVAAYPKYKYIFLKNRRYFFDNIKCIEVGMINLPIIKYFFEYKNLYKQIALWCNNNINEDLYICSYGRRISHALAINKIKKKYKNVTTCMIYGDLSGKLATSIHKKNKYIQTIIDKLLDISIQQSLKFDCAVFFTKYMSEALDNKKPYIVIEGICDEDTMDIKNKQNNKKTIVVYTGILSKKYSLDKLVNAFQYLDEDKYELHLYGIGDYVIELSKIKKNNIKYLGYVDANKISMIQQNADILINPRENNELYTKYSFPSKTMEYLSTGNPVICYKLDGIPDEYDKYLYYIKGNTSTDIANTIIDISKLNQRDLDNHKKKTLEFLMQNKTEKKQCEKVINFMISNKDDTNVKK